ncbi:MAG: lipid-binding SYLF domain-containing protein [Planctomycetota bacterium]|jgi:lipid-binding SYLF domain-containing protein|nr:lipid-binding SYLF domain-containing protein [Planctomycetota bacterium]
MRIITRRGPLVSAVLAVLLIIGAPAEAANASRAAAAKRLGDFQAFVSDFQSAPDRSIPGDLLAQCHGVIIMRQYKAGFVFGVKGGEGVVLLHDPATGDWSPPAFVASGEGSFGFQIGGQAIDAIILIMNRSGVDMLLQTRFKIGVDASAAVGPVGRDAAAQVGPGTALLAYSRTRGLYAGVSFEGGALVNNDRMNETLYGRKTGVRDILINRVFPLPEEAEPLIRTLSAQAVPGNR